MRKPLIAAAGSARLFRGESNSSSGTHANGQRYPARARRDACPDQSNATSFNRNAHRAIRYEPWRWNQVPPVV
jgi:hypothetical protein